MTLMALIPGGDALVIGALPSLLLVIGARAIIPLSAATNHRDAGKPARHRSS